MLIYNTALLNFILKYTNLCLIAVCDRVDALSSVVENLEIYSEQTKEAKKLGSDIIVFPEVL